MSAVAEVYLSLGSNVGNRIQQLINALDFIGSSQDIQVANVSSVYETEPVGDLPQENFYNMAMKIHTILSPHELLELIHEIEASLKRRREVRWGPRTIDIDILLYEDVVQHEKDLVIPHPEMLKRAFVLVPLLEVAPGLRLPDGSELSLYMKGAGGQGVKKIGSLI